MTTYQEEQAAQTALAKRIRAELPKAMANQLEPGWKALPQKGDRYWMVQLEHPSTGRGIYAAFCMRSGAQKNRIEFKGAYPALPDGQSSRPYVHYGEKTHKDSITVSLESTVDLMATHT